ncbi:hypothetical protein I3760_15G096800 [Carya illinoinensis]|uniref:Secreted protein n=1 Tax=Carya illinoinensis TaxID=32201 RepID=A0A922D888_CARIL|nr:hypothetical protein I3760_15G096800 [Carya illinoinensis]KAG6675403.1 hypothetical protein I3842_15G099400 [Carya illinoinensis]
MCFFIYFLLLFVCIWFSDDFRNWVSSSNFSPWPMILDCVINKIYKLNESNMPLLWFSNDFRNWVSSSNPSPWPMLLHCVINKFYNLCESNMPLLG